VDGAAKRRDDLVRDVEPEAQPAVLARGHSALEALEDVWKLVWRNADAVVLHGEKRGAMLGGDRDLNGLAAAELERVGEEVGDDLLEADPVPAADDERFGMDEEG